MVKLLFFTCALYLKGYLKRTEGLPEEDCCVCFFSVRLMLSWWVQHE